MIVTSVDLLAIIWLTQLLAISADRMHCLFIFILLLSKPQQFSSDLCPSPSAPQPVTMPGSLFPGTHHLSSLSFFSLISSHSSSLSVQTCVCRSSTPPVDFRYGERSINHNLLSLIIHPVYCLSGCSCIQS